MNLLIVFLGYFLLHFKTLEGKTHNSIKSNIYEKTFTDDEVIYLQNDMIKLGIDKSKGCGITYLSSTEHGINVINHADMGREVQASFYGGPDAYISPEGETCKWGAFDHWPWNPIACGDQYGNQSPVLSFEKDEAAGVITCSITPLQWACSNVACECSINMKYSLDQMAVKANIELVNNRLSDQNSYPAYDQEFPAVYTNYFLNRLLGYTGQNPWTNGAMTEFETGFIPTQGKWIPGAITSLTEPYLIFSTAGAPVNVTKDFREKNTFKAVSNKRVLNKHGFNKTQSQNVYKGERDCLERWKNLDFAVGVYNSDPRILSYLAGYNNAGDSCKSVENNDPGTLSTAGYIAPIAHLPIAWDETISYDYSIVIATFDTVRSKIYSMHESKN